MKKIILNIIGALFVGLAFTACSPDDFDGANLNKIPTASDYADMISVSVDQEKNTVTCNFTETPGVTPVWVVDGTEYSTNSQFKKYFRKKGTYIIQCFVKNRNGISDGAIDIPVQIDKTIMNGFGGFVKDSEYNLLKDATFSDPSQYYAPGWSPIDPAIWTVRNGNYTITYPEATGERWQAQFAITLSSQLKEQIVEGKKYDFSVILSTSKPHPGIKIKVCNANVDDTPVLMDEDYATEADEPIAMWCSGVDGVNIDQLKIIFDFGGCAENTVVTIEDFVLKDHDNDDGTVVPEKKIAVNWCSVDSQDNLGAVFNSIGQMNFWWADAGWSQTADPTFSFADGVYTIIAAANGGSEWQAQTSIANAPVEIDGGVYYDVRCKVTSSAAIGRYTMKICQQDDDDNSLIYKGDLKLNEGDNIVEFTHLKAAKGDISNMKWIFDFGGTPEGTQISMSDFILQKHNPK